MSNLTLRLETTYTIFARYGWFNEGLDTLDLN